MTATADTPRLAYSALERRATVTTCGALLGLAALAWLLTVDRASGMTGMVQGLAQVGGSASFSMTALVFMAMWVTMMIAMMFPTIAPIVLLHRMVMRRCGLGVTPTATFVGGYLLVWSVTGVVPLATLIGFRHVTGGNQWVARMCGGVIALAGAYQFSRWKQACLRACRTPLTFLSTHNFGSGLLGTLRAGMWHGGYCLGCCWALMTVLFVVGLMNLTWMAAIAVVFIAEKNWTHGVTLTKIVGGLCITLGFAVLVHPQLLTLITSTTAQPQMSM